MSNSKNKESIPERAFAEDDLAETVMAYGDGKGRLPHLFVCLAWIGYAVAMVCYLSMYYFPDLAAWRAW